MTSTSTVKRCTVQADQTETIMEAVKESGVRALVSAGWGGLGGADVPPEVFILKGELMLNLH